MGTKTRGDMVTEVIRRLGNRTNLTGTAVDWVTQSYLELGTRAQILDRYGNRLPEMQQSYKRNLVIGSRTYIQPTGCLFIASIRNNTKDYPLTHQRLRKFQSTLSTTNGVPERWARWRNEYMVDPPPVATDEIQIDYYGKPTSFALAESVTTLPDYLDHAIILGAVALGFEELLEFDRADKMWASQAKYIDSRFDPLANEAEGEESGIGVRYR